MAEIERPSLQDMWTEAEEHFLSLTGKNLSVSPPKTLEDVRREMESQQAQYDAGDKDLVRNAKNVSMNVLYCLRLLGGVAAEGASMVR